MPLSAPLRATEGEPGEEIVSDGPVQLRWQCSRVRHYHSFYGVVHNGRLLVLVVNGATCMAMGSNSTLSFLDLRKTVRHPAPRGAPACAPGEQRSACVPYGLYVALAKRVGSVGSWRNWASESSIASGVGLCIGWLESVLTSRLL